VRKDGQEIITIAETINEEEIFSDLQLELLEPTFGMDTPEDIESEWQMRTLISQVPLPEAIRLQCEQELREGAQKQWRTW
jgi:hypothetical protein